MDDGIIMLPLRVSVGGTRVLVRAAVGAVGCAAKLGGKATVAATRTAVRVSDTVTWGRPAPSFEPPAEPAAPVVSDLRAAPPVPGHSVNGDLSEPPRMQSPRVRDIAPPP